jgi:hypothetical protein
MGRRETRKFFGPRILFSVWRFFLLPDADILGVLIDPFHDVGGFVLRNHASLDTLNPRVIRAIRLSEAVVVWRV